MNPISPQATSDDIDLGALWRAVMDKKGLLAGLVLGSALITLIALQFVTPMYTSQARILIEHEDPTFLRPRNEQPNTDVRVFVDPEAVASQVQVLLSRDLAYEVVKDLKLYEDPEFNARSGFSDALKQVMVALGLAHPPTVSAREERALDNFERHLNVYQVAKSRVIAVDFSSRNPKTAAAVANKLADEYLVWAQKTRLAQTKGASEWLKEQVESLRDKVAKSEAAVEKFRSSTGLIAGSNNVTLETQQLSELNSQLILARAQRSEAEARADLIRRMLKERGDVAAAPDVLKSPLIQRLLEQQVRLRGQLAELSVTLLPSHPRIRQLKSELSDLQRQIRQEAEKVVNSLENEAQIAGAREASLKKSLDDLKKNSSNLREEEIKLRSLEREAKANRDLLESYLARYNEASARDELSAPAHASIISRAYVENEPSFPKKGPITILVAFAVGLLSLVTIIARELMTGAHARYRYADEQVTRVAEPISVSERATYQPRAAEMEAAEREGPAGSSGDVRAYRTKARSARAAAKLAAMRCGGGKGHDLIVTASSHSANTARDSLDVARAMAARGLRVAIVDFSSTGTGVADLVGLANIPGLGELLSGNAGFEDVISADPGGSVQIIPPGALSRDVFAGEAAGIWAKVHHALRQTYDCLVLHVSLTAARRLIAGMHADEVVTVLLVTGGSEDGLLIDQVAGHLMSEGGAAMELVTYRGAKAEPAMRRVPGMTAGARNAAAAV